MASNAARAEGPVLRVFAPAKINWVLTIRGRRPDGFHDLDTVFQTLQWGDVLACRRMDAPGCRILCDAPGIPLGEDNLIARAWRLLRERDPRRVGGLEVALDKRLPSGAGLGGGSADAVAALVAVDRLYRLRLGPGRLEELAAELGSDCAFFVRGGTALAGGRGEQLRPIANRLPSVWLVVVWPGFGSATAEAYRRVTPAAYEGGEAAASMAGALERGDLGGVQKLVRNCFSPLVSAGELRYKYLQDHMIRQGLRTPMLSGSGSAMFAFAVGRAHARKAAAELGCHYPISEAVRLRRVGVRVIPSR